MKEKDLYFMVLGEGINKQIISYTHSICLKVFLSSVPYHSSLSFHVPFLNIFHRPSSLNTNPFNIGISFSSRLITLPLLPLFPLPSSQFSIEFTQHDHAYFKKKRLVIPLHYRFKIASTRIPLCNSRNLKLFLAKQLQRILSISAYRTCNVSPSFYHSIALFKKRNLAMPFLFNSSKLHSVQLW